MPPGMLLGELGGWELPLLLQPASPATISTPASTPASGVSKAPDRVELSWLRYIFASIPRALLASGGGYACGAYSLLRLS